MLPRLGLATLALLPLSSVLANPSPAPAWSMLRGSDKTDAAGGSITNVVPNPNTPPVATLKLMDLAWSTEKGAILLNGRHHFHIKGLNWFGIENAETRAPHGLWSTTLDDVLDFLALNHFNTLRLPVSYTVAHDLALAVPPSAVGADPSLKGLNVGQLLDTIFDRAAARGILIILALHNDDITSPDDKGLWYGSASSYHDFQDAWRRLLARTCWRWNLLGADLLDRPGRGHATWGNKDPSHDWNLAAQDTAAMLSKEYPIFKGLWFVQGIEGGKFAANFATDLRGAYMYPLDLFTPANTKRVVYEVVLMGPSVLPSMSYAYSTAFPDNMYSAYDDLFAVVEGSRGRAVVVGKWGGTYDDANQGDAMWHEAVANYFVARCMDDTIYMGVNPNADNIGGVLLDDWRTPNEAKLALLHRVSPRPSVLLRSTAPGARWWEFVPGSSANPACN